MRLEEWNAISQGIYAVSTGAIAFAASLGVGAWRRQLRGRSAYNLARDTLQCVYKLRDRLQWVRNPAVWGVEYYGRPGRPADLRDVDADDYAYVYRKRWEPVGEVGRELELLQIQAKVLWQDQLKSPSRKLAGCVTDLNGAVADFLESKQQSRRVRNDEGNPKDLERVLYNLSREGKDDEFTTRLKLAVSEFEQVLRPHMK